MANKLTSVKSAIGPSDSAGYQQPSFMNMTMEEADARPRSFDFMDSLSAATEQSAQNMAWNEVKSLWEDFTSDSKPTDKLMSPKALNEKYADLGNIFTESMSEGAAETIANKHRRNRELQERIDNGPDGVAQGIANFAGRLLPHAIDPVNLAGNVGVSVLLKTRMVVGALKATKFGRAIGVGQKSLTAGQGFGQTVTEGLIGNIPGEVLSYQGAKRDLMEYGVDDAFINAVGGVLGFAGFKYAFAKGISWIKGPKEAKVQAHEMLNTILNDKKPGKAIEARKVDIVQETNGLKIHYEFQDKDLSNTKLHAASPEATRTLQKTLDEFGEGYKLTDNENQVHGEAGSKLSDVDGTVYDVDVSELKLERLDDPVSDSLAKIVLEETKIKHYNNKTGEILTGRQLLEKVRSKLGDEGVNRVNSRLAATGVDGYHHNGGPRHGVDHGHSNNVLLFGEEKIKGVAARPVDRTKVGGLSQKELSDVQSHYQSRESDIDYHQQDVDDFAKIEDYKDPTEIEMRKEVDDIMEELDEIAKSENKYDGFDEELAELKEIEGVSKEAESAFKLAFNCVGKG